MQVFLLALRNKILASTHFLRQVIDHDLEV